MNRDRDIDTSGRRDIVKTGRDELLLFMRNVPVTFAKQKCRGNWQFRRAFRRLRPLDAAFCKPAARHEKGIVFFFLARLHFLVGLGCSRGRETRKERRAH